MGKTTNPRRQEKYKAQFAITDRNRARKLLSHIARHPDDRQAASKLERV